MLFVTGTRREANTRHKLWFLLGQLPTEDCGITHRLDRFNSTTKPGTTDSLRRHPSPLMNRSCNRFQRPRKNSHRISTAESIA